jgi:hypothetical protein
MHALSRAARQILERMESDRRYGTLDLRAILPEASAENIREVMHELWVNRQVERVGDGWQRHRSVAPHQQPAPAEHGRREVAAASAVRQTKGVKPEDLFDHDAFNDFFR